MRVIRRNPATSSLLTDGGIRQHAAVFAVIFSSSLILAVRPAWILGLNLHCGMQVLFGLKCPFCGMTRDFAAILQGQSPALNPCSWIAAVVVYVVYPATFLGCWFTQRLHIFHQPRTYRCVAVALLAMFVLNNVRYTGFAPGVSGEKKARAVLQRGEPQRFDSSRGKGVVKPV